MCGTPAWFLHALEGINKGASRVGEAAEVGRTFERAPGGVSMEARVDSGLATNFYSSSRTCSGRETMPNHALAVMPTLERPSSL